MRTLEIMMVEDGIRLFAVVQSFADPQTAREVYETMSRWLREGSRPYHYHICVTRECHNLVKCWCSTYDDDTAIRYCDTCDQIRRDAETDGEKEEK